jgi:hypothetical protein
MHNEKARSLPPLRRRRPAGILKHYASFVSAGEGCRLACRDGKPGPRTSSNRRRYRTRPFLAPDSPLAAAAHERFLLIACGLQVDQPVGS